MSAPAHVTETIATLRSERAAVAARLDAIELSLYNLSRVWNADAPAQRAARARNGGVRKRARKVVRHAGREIVKIIQSGGPMSAAALITATGRPRRAVLRSAARLVASGRLVKNGRRSPYVFELPRLIKPRPSPGEEFEVVWPDRVETANGPKSTIG